MPEKKLLQRVLRRITPSKAEKKAQAQLAAKIIDSIKKTGGSHIDVMLCGSNARDTHLKGDHDLDIFVLFPEKLSRKDFEKEGLKIGKKIFRGYKWEKAFSEHPYIRGEIDGYAVEIVPSYKVGSAELKQSSVDRSPFHCTFLKERLDEKHRQEIRLLRQFFKGIKAYGADIKASSVPGYVVELLVLEYGSFWNAVKAIAEWKQGTVVDIAKQLGLEEAKKMFPGNALIVIDPVDKNRNVAAALSLNQFSRVVAAAQAFLRKPSESFFFGKKGKKWGIKKMRAMLKKKELVAVRLGYPKNALPDIVWGQIQRFARKIETQLQLSEFKVTRSAAWTDEKSVIVIVIEVESRGLQKTHTRQGPFVTDGKNSRAFLQAHKHLIAGPRIEQGRWVIETARKHTSIEKFLRDFLKKEKRVEKKQLKKAINKGSAILEEENIAELFKKNNEFAEFLTAYLKGEEEFLAY